MQLGERIREARIRAGMTQDELAQAIGVARNSITGYEKGVREPDALKLIALAKALGVTGDYLLDLHIKADTLSDAAQSFARKYDALDKHGRRIVELVLEAETARIEKYGPLRKTETSGKPMSDEEAIALASERYGSVDVSEDEQAESV